MSQAHHDGGSRAGQQWELMQGPYAGTCSLDKEFVFSLDGKSLEVLKRASNWNFEKALVAPLWRINPRRAQVATGSPSRRLGKPCGHE